MPEKSNPIDTIAKWIMLIVFFPLSLIFYAYFKQRKARKEYYKND